MVIVAGFGCRAGATTDAFAAALAATGVPYVDRFAVPADRAALLDAFAREHGVPLMVISPDKLRGIATPTRSPISLAARGTGSVAEAAALVAAGVGARVSITRCISPDRSVTCAIAVSGSHA
ncbi:cobalt-precorrin 5A hydrolase [Sphingomonas palmae]|uniref:Cobalt-precorrin 5A hydrolase n=1 Tax=Sphingomonas palmae TaxID=1855283 RepID=A0A1H7MBI5_9SPHN|nr:cobalt-precorrin 5A hydrolase [Sphingomonas palmae]